MTKFRSKSVVIEAMQFDGTLNGAIEILKWAGDNAGIKYEHEKEKPHRCFLMIKTWEGKLSAIKGDWIIRGTEGEFYPCKPVVFEKKYERLEDSCLKE